MSAVWPTASTRVVALLGWPARHSLSPLLHNAAFREQGLDLCYVALPTHPDDLATVVAALGAVEAAGANVTVPHKEAVVASCDRLTEEAELVGAVNTLAWDGDGLVGDNTDAVGLGEVLRGDVGLPAGTPAVVLGTGGAARACAVALGRLGCPTTVVGRRPAAAEAVASVAAAAGAPQAVTADLADGGTVRAAVAAAGIVLNATPLGMAGEPLPDPFQALRPGQFAYDLVYGAAETPFLAAAAVAGAEVHHGLGMLVAQAAASYRRWTGRDAPTATMSAVALSAIAGGPDVTGSVGEL